MESGAVGNGGQRRLLLAEGRVDSGHLRDLLRLKQDDDDDSNSEKRLLPARTLLDIIRDDPSGAKENKKSWRVFRDKLRLCRAGHAWISTVRTPASDVPIPNTNRTISRPNLTLFPTGALNSEDPSSHSIHPSTSGENRPELNHLTSSRTVSRSGHGAEGSTSLNTRDNNVGEPADEETEDGAGETAEELPVRTSLMALLAESDGQLSLDGSGFMMNDEEDEEEEEEEAEIAGRGAYNNCCVCMVRHKGAAFIPCGHTFCRLCSRELWVQRGNCPLCNGFILEVLDIF
ncbi:uncharacterized protein LOC127787332 [Diospyros lotus]|uniref:uncharacterized protein LOC127787332 n=1 Tax=Diospyros lotus TaxID=55363 RepID=UPI00225632AD|nr:uncharacterized protein LOC127787332 [Diospyros lotus]